MSRGRRETLAALACALWGLALAIALIQLWQRPAPPGQTPGLATALGFDAHGPFRWIAGLILLPAFLPLLVRPLWRRLAEGRLWALSSVLAAAALSVWIAPLGRSVAWTIVPFILTFAVCLLLRDRDLRFSRHDAILVPVFLTTLLALIDIVALPGHHLVYLAAAVVFALRVAVALIPSSVPPAFAFVLAPLGVLLQTSFFARDQRYFGWHALAVVVITPLVMRAFAPRAARLGPRAVALIVFPLFLYGYANAMSPNTAEGKSRMNFFEDGHSLLPASEMLRGERPYADILPAHGLIEDGLFDLGAMRLSGVTAGARAKARFVVTTLAIVALYFLALAVLGSAGRALLAVLLTVMVGAYTPNLRMLAGLLPLIPIAAAVRLRRPRLFAVAGFLVVLCGATTLDFAAYALITLVVAVLRFPSRREAARWAAIGIGAAALPLFALLAAFGILDDFFTGTFVDVLRVGPAYVLTFFTPPPLLKNVPALPEALKFLLDRDVFQYLVWGAVALFVGTALTLRRSRRVEALLLLGVWTLATAISYAERHHLYFEGITAIFAVWVMARLLRSHRALGIAAVVAAVALASPTTHLQVLSWMRTARGPVEPGWVEIRDLPRARGVLFHENDARYVAGVKKYLELSLAPDETFFDFTNSGILYFLFRRDCPVPYYEVPFYQSEETQRRVIAMLERNPKVRAALVPSTPLGRFTIDGVPNADRAPLVWQYLQQNFAPDFHEGEVMVWRRVSPLP